MVMIAGLYTLANDVVYDQLIALLNSIEVNAPGLPVCVIAYDQQIERVRQAISERDQVTLLDDPDLFAEWEEFSYQVWRTHPTALAAWKAQGITTRFRRVGENRRYVGFDPRAPFEHFIYLDADTLVMGPLERVFTALQAADFAIYDFQYKSPDHIFNVGSPRLTQVFGPEVMAQHIFCSGFYGAHRGVFSADKRAWLLEQLEQGDAEILYTGAPNQSLLNYMVHKSGLRVQNLVFSQPKEAITGNSVTSSHFKARDHILYDKGARLTFLHYIGISSKSFRALCAGENITFPYRDIFMHYRYLKAPQERPRLLGLPRSHRNPKPWSERVLGKFQQVTR